MKKNRYPVSITDQRQTVNMNDDMNNIEDKQWIYEETSSVKTKRAEESRI